MVRSSGTVSVRSTSASGPRQRSHSRSAKTRPRRRAITGRLVRAGLSGRSSAVAMAGGSTSPRRSHRSSKRVVRRADMGVIVTATAPRSPTWSRSGTLTDTLTRRLGGARRASVADASSTSTP
jgi:hypothetical protein